MKHSLIALAMMSAASFANAESVELGSDAFNEAVRSYLLENPEVIFEAVDVYNARQEVAQAEAAKEAVTDNQDTIYDESYALVLGDPEAEFAMVEFVDYNCGYCRKSHEEMGAIIEENPDTKILVKQLPILSQGSLDASKVVIALKQEYSEEDALALHNYLYGDAEGADLETALAFAEERGLDRAKIEEALESETVYAALAQSHQLAEALQIDGTPGFVVGDELVRGYVPAAQMNKIIEQKKNPS